MNTFPYQIINIRTNPRKPGFIYATIVNDKNTLCVNATLDYCVKWIKNMQYNIANPDSGIGGGC